MNLKRNGLLAEKPAAAAEIEFKSSIIRLQ